MPKRKALNRGRKRLFVSLIERLCSNQLLEGGTVTEAENKKENREHLEMIRKAMDLIDDRVFLILNSVEIESARGWVAQFRRAHDELGEMITHLADLAGIQEDEE